MTVYKSRCSPFVFSTRLPIQLFGTKMVVSEVIRCFTRVFCFDENEYHTRRPYDSQRRINISAKTWWRCTFSVSFICQCIREFHSRRLISRYCVSVCMHTRPLTVTRTGKCSSREKTAETKMKKTKVKHDKYAFEVVCVRPDWQWDKLKIEIYLHVVDVCFWCVFCFFPLFLFRFILHRKEEKPRVAFESRVFDAWMRW